MSEQWDQTVLTRHPEAAVCIPQFKRMNVKNANIDSYRINRLIVPRVHK